MVSFNPDQGPAATRKGYSVTALGKPVDFVLQIASMTTGQEDYFDKRTYYATFGVTEYG